MRKAVMLLVVVLLLSLGITCPVFAGRGSEDDRGVMFGIKCGTETVSQTKDINGGSYFYLNPLISFSPIFSLNLKYSTDLTPQTFSDHLFSVTPQFLIKTISSHGDEIAQMYLGFTYLRSTNRNYFGIKYCPWANGRGLPDYRNVIIDMLPISLLYCPETAETMIKFEWIALGGYF